jgi:calcium-dependent protein kinase
MKMDIWALGCIVYHMLTGVPPHRAASTEALVDRIKSSAVEFREDWDVLTQDARDATERMLMVNASLRPSAAAMLRHPWLRLNRESVPKGRMLRLLSNIRENASESHFKRMVMRVIAQQLPHESREIRTIEKAFRFFDRNGDGVLGVPEICLGVKKLEILNEKEMKELTRQLELLDRDGSQTVNLQEFVAGSLDAKRVLTSANLWHAFNAFDIDSNGSVSVSEIEEIVRKYEAGLLATDQVEGICRRLRREMEKAVPDGKLDFNQFVYIMSTPSNSPDRTLAIKRDVFSFAQKCLGVDCYKVQRIEPKRWNWQQASRSPHSVYRRAGLVAPGRKYSKNECGMQGGPTTQGEPPKTSPSPSSRSSQQSDRPSQSGKSPSQSRKSSKGSRN